MADVANEGPAAGLSNEHEQDTEARDPAGQQAGFPLVPQARRPAVGDEPLAGPAADPLGAAATGQSQQDTAPRSRARRKRRPEPTWSDGIERIKFFSDAVFAIAITLLSLNLAVARGTASGHLGHELASIWPQYAAFAFTFFLIGLRWLTHLVQFRYIQSYDYMLLGLNLVLLSLVAFLPFASRVLAAYPNSRTASVLYTAAMALAGLISTVLWRHACKSGLIDESKADKATQQNLLARWAALPLFFGISIVLIIIVPNLWWARGVALGAPIMQIWLASRSRATGHPA